MHGFIGSSPSYADEHGGSKPFDYGTTIIINVILAQIYMPKVAKVTLFKRFIGARLKSKRGGTLPLQPLGIHCAMYTVKLSG